VNTRGKQKLENGGDKKKKKKNVKDKKSALKFENLQCCAKRHIFCLHD